MLSVAARKAFVSSQDRLDEEFMRRALELARASVGLASPNPQVGCVLVRDGVVVGEGAHFYDEFDHAEIVALKQAGELAPGATAYVTLEPCSHHGRTGPCADALIAAGVGRVVVATVDPNPLVSGQGIALLRAGGIEAVVGLLEQEAREVNDAFARFIRTGRPLVTLKAAVSADGMLAPDGSRRKPGEPFWLTGAEARAEVQRMRHGSDAVLTGIGTVLADDPALTDRSGLVGPGGRARRRPLLRVVLDSRLRIPMDSELVRSANRDVLVVCGTEVESERVAALEAAGVEVERVDARDGRLDLDAVLDVLGKRKILSVLLECGSELTGAFLAEGLVDRVVLFYSETRLGERAVPFVSGEVSPFELERKLKDVSRAMFGADTRVSGELRDPWDKVGMR
jgi:diaminohydroxyphosphoribosylaminopyrimidine deaminase/5-amino-6-(5-phosphoribosylamino)uracil reductase